MADDACKNCREPIAKRSGWWHTETDRQDCSPGDLEAAGWPLDRINDEVPQAEPYGFETGFRAAITALELTGADMLDDAIAEAREAEPDQPWEDED